MVLIYLSEADSMPSCKIAEHPVKQTE